MRRTPREELGRRASRFQSALQENGMDGALIVQNADLFYFAGTMQTSHLFIPAEGQPLLMTRRSYERARAESTLEHTVPLSSLRELPALLSGASARPARMGLELDVLSVNSFFGYQRLLPQVAFQDVSGIIRAVRAVKSPYEIAIQREAAVLNDRVFSAVPELLREGMTEVEFAGLLEAVARREGHPGLVRMRFLNQELFYGHVLSGDSGSAGSFVESPTGGVGLGPAMPQGASRKPILRGEPILVDLVAVVDGLMVDQTRIFALEHLPDDLRGVHTAMLEVQEAMRLAARPGLLGSELYDLAARESEALGVGEHFMGFGETRAAFVGHGVGLELNELPVLSAGYRQPLQAGNVFALEPKCVIPGRGAVGIENTWLVTAGGLERLTTTSDALTIL